MQNSDNYHPNGKSPQTGFQEQEQNPESEIENENYVSPNEELVCDASELNSPVVSFISSGITFKLTLPDLIRQCAEQKILVGVETDDLNKSLFLNIIDFLNQSGFEPSKVLKGEAWHCTTPASVKKYRSIEALYEDFLSRETKKIKPKQPVEEEQSGVDKKKVRRSELVKYHRERKKLDSKK